MNPTEIALDAFFQNLAFFPETAMFNKTYSESGWYDIFSVIN